MPPPGFRKTIIRSKIERTLTPEHWAEYQKLLKDRRSTVDSLHAWLHERGYKVGRMTVGRHRRRFDADVESVRKTAMLAEQLAEASLGGAAGGMGALADATLARFQQVLLENLLKLGREAEGDGGAAAPRTFSTREMLELSKAVSETVSARRNLEALRREFDDRARRAADAVEHAAAARAAPGKRKSTVVNGVEIANCVRRILGVPLPGEPVPDGPILPLLPPADGAAPDGSTSDGGPPDDPILRRVEEAFKQAKMN